MSSIIDLKKLAYGYLVSEQLVNAQFSSLDLGGEFEDAEGNRWLCGKNDRGSICAIGLSPSNKGKVTRQKFLPTTQIKKVRRIYKGSV